jgi:Flp pilus assembly protein CpaB
MKWAVVILLVLGLLAAGSAALLFEWVQVKNFQPSSQAAAVDVLLAQVDLPARTRVAADHVKVERVPKAGLPDGCFTNQAQAIGKTLKVAVIKGQPLTGACFLPETAIDDLLRPGMLAYQISLTRRTTPVDLLYPGCIVDVFATFPLHNKAKGEAVVIPLLQNIQVLGVRDQTVVTPVRSKKEPAGPATLSPASGSVTVSLEVNARQVAALQLVLEKGSLGLAMRNPLDKNPNPVEPMVMKEGQLTAASEAMDPQTLALVDQLQQLLGNKPPADANCPPRARPVAKAPDPNTLADAVGSLSPKRSAWQMTVIRGQKVEETEVKLVDNEDEAAPPAPTEKTGTEE